MAALAYPREDLILKKLGMKNAKIGVRQGLDLKGGVHLVYEADFSKKPGINKEDAIKGLVNVMQKRANPAGVSEIVVQRTGESRIIVEIPGEQDSEAAVARIGKLAELTFLERPADGQSIVPTNISGEDIERATADIDPTTGTPIVSLKMKGGESTKKFSELTTRLNKSGGQIVTYLDDRNVFGPAQVSSPITDGNAQLQGDFKSIKDAREVAADINSGALPVPVKLEQKQVIGPTLGSESVAKSLVAGIIGLVMVAIFMLAYYRLAGVVAVGALGLYSLITLSIYKLSIFTPAPIVLTLAGIAGFILSIGMAVDANILMFERMRDELRHGHSLHIAAENGFKRAWPSIRDSNVSTLITCLILYNFAGNTPVIKGFAVTLGLGVIISMFTAVTASRTLLRETIKIKRLTDLKLYGVSK